MAVQYTVVDKVDHEEVFDLLVRSGLFANVTIPLDATMVGAAFDGSNLVVMARLETGELICVCSTLTDFVRNCFVATLAVAPDTSKQGIGRALIARAHHEAGGADRVKLFLHSGPSAEGFYECIGMVRETACFSFNNVN